MRAVANYPLQTRAIEVDQVLAAPPSAVLFRVVDVLRFIFSSTVFGHPANALPM